MEQSSFAYIIEQTRLCLTKPREALRNVLTVPMSLGTVIQIALVVIIADVLLSQIDIMISPDFDVPAQFEILTKPLGMMAYLAINVLFLVLSVMIIGRFSDAPAPWFDILKTIIWLLFILTAVKAVITALNLLLPGISGMLILPLFFLQLYLLVMFSAELHGFENYGAVALGLFAAAFVLAMFLAPLLAILGVLPLGMTNV